MCLGQDRFQVTVGFVTDEGADIARVASQAGDSGTFYFFRPQNWEVLLKVLDNCGGTTDQFWVFAAGATTLEWTFTVTDTDTGATRSYTVPQGSGGRVANTMAFDCP